MKTLKRIGFILGVPVLVLVVWIGLQFVMLWKLMNDIMSFIGEHTREYFDENADYFDDAFRTFSRMWKRL